MVTSASASKAAVLIVAMLAFAGTVGAHVQLDHPNGGEVLEAGTTAVIEWHILISHATLNWDLWYSLTGPGGPWMVIAEDLPPGNINSGAVHTFDWLVPGAQSNEVRVRVLQDNDGVDYEDLSDDDFTIEAVLFEDDFESGTTGAWSAVEP